jgi:PKD repeat protein
VQHAFSNFGLQTVTLTVSAPGGTSNSTTRSFAIPEPGPIVATFTVKPDKPPVNTEVIFDASASTVGAGARIVLYEWSFGDGVVESSTIPVTKKTYTSRQVHIVTLRVTDSLGRTAIFTKAVEVI